MDPGGSFHFYRIEMSSPLQYDVYFRTRLSTPVMEPGWNVHQARLPPQLLEYRALKARTDCGMHFQLLPVVDVQQRVEKTGVGYPTLWTTDESLPDVRQIGFYPPPQEGPFQQVEEITYGTARRPEIPGEVGKVDRLAVPYSQHA